MNQPAPTSRPSPWTRHAIALCIAVAQAALGCQSDVTDVYGGVFDADSDSASSGGEAELLDPSPRRDYEPASGDDESDDVAPVGFDVGAPLGEPLQSSGCPAVDLLFVIDNSGSMGDEQLNLAASFPGFIDGISDLLGPATDYHVGVVTTDAYEWNAPECQSLGGLTVRTGGDLSSAAACGPFASGRNFMTVDDDLDQAFSCAARVGIDGAGIERPMEALQGALLDPMEVNGACNQGFLRDDALLVVVLITDEEDAGDSLGDPTDWYDTVLDAKGGDEDAVVMLSLIGHDKPNECIAAQWTGMMGAEIAPRLLAFTGLFEHGIVGDVCAADYGAFFADAVEGIADACGIIPTPAG
ncbi:MAG: hypothetical protein AAF721_23925 [Myxococcota bacterium]